MPSKDEVRKLLEQKLTEGDFVRMCGVQPVEISRGKVVLSMKVTRLLTNIYRIVHGGALFTLMDTCIGFTCLTLGKRIVTLDMSTNFLKAVPEGETVTATAEVLHAGKTTIVAEANTFDSKGRLVAKATATFFVLGNMEDIPQEW